MLPAQPSAEVVAAAAAFVAAAEPVLGPRALLLAVFAAAGGHALLARELAFSLQDSRHLCPISVFGMGAFVEDMVGGGCWLVQACAAAAARRGHSAACSVILRDNPRAWRSHGAADPLPSVTAAAAAGQLAVLAALPAQRAGADATQGLVPGSRLWRWALRAACQGGQPEAVAALLEGCTAGAPRVQRPAFGAPQRDEICELLARVCVRPRGAQVQAILLRFDRAARAGGHPLLALPTPEAALSVGRALARACAPIAVLEAHFEHVAAMWPGALVGCLEAAVGATPRALRLKPAVCALPAAPRAAAVARGRAGRRGRR
jgi:hypothetical protein